MSRPGEEITFVEALDQKSPIKYVLYVQHGYVMLANMDGSEYEDYSVERYFDGAEPTVGEEFIPCRDQFWDCHVLKPDVYNAIKARQLPENEQ